MPYWVCNCYYLIMLLNCLRLFEQRCIAIMDGMYEEDTKQAINLMDDEADVWGICSSPLTFAYENFIYDVVAHTCSQKNMNKQWYNKLAPDLKPFLKVNVTKEKKGLNIVINFEYKIELHESYYIMFEYKILYWIDAC